MEVGGRAKGDMARPLWRVKIGEKIKAIKNVDSVQWTVVVAMFVGGGDVVGG